MATTKERILHTALELFNQEGFDRVTTRHIAAHMGISHGNLCYHFGRREDIALTLYHQMQAATESLFGHVMTSTDTFGAVYLAIDQAFRLHRQYGFLFLNKMNVFRRITELQPTLQSIHHLRIGQFRSIVALLANRGLLLPEPLPGQWDHFAMHQYLVAETWLAAAEIRTGPVNEATLRKYVDNFIALAVPYLNADGLRQLQGAREHYLRPSA